ncbi:MAG: DUF416 family protein [Hormoscilla sp. GUM202]|nr:DUF416 family protein [Hormoscilla sp. GUM202]
MLTPKRPIFFNFKTFKKELVKLPLRHQIAFNAACCERIIPNYNAFSRVTNSGDPSVPRKALDAVWHFLEGEPMDAVKYHQLREEIYSLPLDDIESLIDIDSDECQNLFLYGVDAVLDAICQTLEACFDPNIKSFFMPVDKAREIVEFFVESLDEDFPDNIDSVYPNLEILDRDKMDILDKHPLSIREVAKENEDLQRLQETPILDREILEWLRTSFDNDGKSNINLG